LELEIPKTPWNPNTKLVDIEACGQDYNAHLLSIHAGPESAILIYMDRQATMAPDDPHADNIPTSPKCFSWEGPDNEDCIRLVVFKYQQYMGARMTGDGRVYTVTLGNLYNDYAEQIVLHIGAGFTWALLQTKWCKSALTTKWNWPFKSMRFLRATFRLDPVDERRGIRLTEEDGEIPLLTFMPRTFTIMDIKKFIMTIREHLHGRPLAIIQEEGPVANVLGITYDVPIIGSAWHRPIDLAPSIGGTGMNLRYLLLMFEKAGSLAPYVCRDCHREVRIPGGTCEDCSILLDRMKIQVF
jgi:hypothetical protein